MALYLNDMTKTDLLKLRTKMMSLTVFRDILSCKTVSSLLNYIGSLDMGMTAETVSAYSAFVHELYEENGGNLSKCIEQLVYDCENVYVKAIGAKQIPEAYIAESVGEELSILSHLASLTSVDLCEPLRWDGFMPKFFSEKISLTEKYEHRVRNIAKYGYGKYAHSRMFYIDVHGEIVPVKSPDRIRLDELVGYKLQRTKILENTNALLQGKPAANILLTGDAGTGKSSTIKAVVNELADEGLRIIEVRKDQLDAIPSVLDKLADNPLKFILFIDDLSFLSDDDSFNGLKAVLEGSVAARSQNVVVYATSNRRHIIRENFSDRDGDEIHRNDAMQEMISLSDRFGMHISFHKPEKKTYLDIVNKLAEQLGVIMPPEKLELLAERFALERGGRSARLARQFIDGILAGVIKE